MSLDLETPSPKFMKREENGGSKYIPPLLALGELEFKKAFLLLSYIGGYVRLEQFLIFNNQFLSIPLESDRFLLQGIPC